MIWLPILINGSEPFVFPIGSLGSFVDYAIADLSGKVVRQGRLQINYKSGEDAECIDEYDIQRPEEIEVFLPEYDVIEATQLIKFRATPVEEGLLLEYHSRYSQPVRMRFKTSLVYLIPGRPIGGAIDAEIMIEALLLTPPEEYDFKFIFSDLPIMTDANEFVYSFVPTITGLNGNIEVRVVSQQGIALSEFEISTNYRPSEIGYQAWGNWVSDTLNRYEYFWAREDDNAGVLLVRMKPNFTALEFRIGICGDRTFGGENCNCQMFIRNRVTNVDLEVNPERAVRNSTHLGFGIHGALPIREDRTGPVWLSRLFFFDYTRFGLPT